jgi:hypothetical protein
MFIWIETRQSLDKNNRWSHSHLLTHTNHVYVLPDGEAVNVQFFHDTDGMKSILIYLLMLVASFICGKFHVF